MEPGPIYLVAPPGAERDRLASHLGGSRVTSFDSVERMGPLKGYAPGVVVVATSTARGMDTRFARLAEAMSVSSPEWSLVAASGPGMDLKCVSFRCPDERSVGTPAPPTARESGVRMEEAAGSGADPAEGKGEADSARLAELECTLASVDKVRHDLNNILTSALAEVQMLLLDEATPEVTESHEFVQAQLRAMRDLVASMARPRI